MMLFSKQCSKISSVSCAPKPSQISTRGLLINAKWSGRVLARSVRTLSSVSSSELLLVFTIQEGARPLGVTALQSTLWPLFAFMRVFT